MLKTCSKCSRELPIDRFVKDNRIKSGLTCYCYDCKNKTRNDRREDNREKALERETKWRKENRDKVLLSKKIYYRNHRETADETIKRWRISNPDKVKTYNRKYEEKNSEIIKASRKKFKDANRERINEANRIYKLAHPDRYRDYCENRRARIRDKFVDDVKRSIVFERDNGVCHICGAIVDKSDWHLDHVIPLSAGGEHSYANVAVSHPSCNLQKSAQC